MFKIGNISLEQIGWFLVVNFYTIYLLSDFIGLMEYRFVFSNEGRLADYNTQISSGIKTGLKFVMLLFSIRCMLFRRISNFTFFLLIFLSYSLFTGFAYIGNDRPLSLFIGGINAMIIPAFFYFVGNNRNYLSDKFYKRTLWVLVISFCIGLLLHFTMQDFYVWWKIRGFMASRGVEWGGARGSVGQINSSFISISGGYFTGYMSFVGLSIAYKYYTERYSLWNLCSIIVCFIVLLLSQVRVAILTGLLMITIYHIYGFMSRRKHLNFLFVSYAVVLLILFLIFHNVLFDLIEGILGRIGKIFTGDAIAERSYTWVKLISSQTNFIFGHGLQSGGAAAASMGFTGVNDGEVFKFLYEGGIIGLLGFLLLNIFTLIRGIKNIFLYSLEVPIILVFLLATAGANPFSNMSGTIMMYWFCMGRIWNKNYKLKEID